MPVDPLAVATVGFRASIIPADFALCIATEGYQCQAPVRPQGGGGTAWWCPPDEEPCIASEDAAKIVWNTIQQWNDEVAQTSRDLAAMVGLKAFPGGESPGTQFAAVVALVVEEEDPEDET